jgi:hypothetical protein
MEQGIYGSRRIDEIAFFSKSNRSSQKAFDEVIREMIFIVIHSLHDLFTDVPCGRDIDNVFRSNDI